MLTAQNNLWNPGILSVQLTDFSWSWKGTQAKRVYGNLLDELQKWKYIGSEKQFREFQYPEFKANHA